MEADLGDPTVSTDYELCVYDHAADIPALVASVKVPPSSLWEPIVAPGFAYKDKTLSASGVQKAKLRAGETGKTRVELRARGINLVLPPPATASEYFAADQRVVVQLVNSDGKCWSNEFLGDDIRRNKVDRFQAKAR